MAGHWRPRRNASSKDLQLAAWLTEALLKQQGMRGLREGLVLCDHMLSQFWDTLYPEMEEGDLEMRSGPIEFLAGKLATPVKGLAISDAGYTFFQYKESRLVQYEDLAKSKEEKSARDKALKEGKLAPELFDKSFVETPKAFYFEMEKQIDEALGVVPALDKTCQEKFADAAPSFGKLKEGIQEVRQVVHSLLQKKRETEPDPVEVVEAPPAEGSKARRRRRFRFWQGSALRHRRALRAPEDRARPSPMWLPPPLCCANAAWSGADAARPAMGCAPSSDPAILESAARRPPAVKAWLCGKWRELSCRKHHGAAPQPGLADLRFAVKPAWSGRQLWRDCHCDPLRLRGVLQDLLPIEAALRRCGGQSRPRHGCAVG
jgi:hypothetical protein